MSNSEPDVLKVSVSWDSQDLDNEGWYAVSYVADGSFGGLREYEDSQKIWFPVQVDDYDRDQADELREALAEAFPDAILEFC